MAIATGSAAAGTLYWDTDGSATGNSTVTGAGLGGAGNWSTAVANWWDGSSITNTVWTEGSDAIFWGTAGAVTLSGPRTVGNMTFNTTGYSVTASTLTFSGAGKGVISVPSGGTATFTGTGPTLIGSIGCSVVGGGTAIFNSTASTLTGAVSISGGSTLELASSGCIGGTGAGAGDITLNGGTLRNDSLTAAGIFLTANRNIILGASGGTINVPSSSTILLYSGVISGTGNTLTVGGSTGELRITTNSALAAGGHNTFSKLVVDTAIFTLGHSTTNAADDSLGAVPGSALPDAITLKNNGRIRGNVASMSLNANRGITLGTGGGTIRNVTGTLTIPSIITGSTDLTIGTIDAGAVTLSGNNSNTFTGRVIVNTGTLNIASDNNLGAVPASFAADQIKLNGGTLAFTATAVDIPTNRGITLTANSTLAVSSSQAPFIESVITGGFQLTKSSAGNINLDGSNTFTGGLLITGGGVRFNNPQAAGTGTITVTPGSLVTLRQLSPPGPTSITLTNPITLNANGGNDIDLAGAAGNTFTLNGNISGVGYLTRDRGAAGNGTVVLGGDNSGWSGGMFHRGSVLGLGNKRALGTGTYMISPATADPLTLTATTALTGVNAITNTVQIAVSNATQQITIGGSSALEISGPIILGLANTLAPDITNNNSGGTLFSGVISGPAGIGFTNDGTGILTISGNGNTYTGPTVVNGNLKVAGSIAASSGVTVNNNGTLSGSGTVPAFVINSGGTISPGSSPGNMATGAGTWAGGGHYKWEINEAGGTAGADPGWDQLGITGGLNITASSGSPFNIDIASLTLADAAGVVSDFDNTTVYTWSILHTTAGITNFNAAAFVLNTAGFSNSLGNGAFVITTNATDILLQFLQKPAIASVLPANPTQIVGDNITFTATASGSGTLSYQWRKGGVPIGLATGSTYSIFGLHVADGGNYDVVVTNLYGSATSSVDVLTVLPANQTITFAPISDQPYGAVVALSPTASSGLPVSLSVLSGPATLAGNNLTVTGIGAVSVQASQSGNADYNAATNVTQNFNAITATLNVTADNFSRAFGATNPIFTASYSGFATGESLTNSDVTGSPVLGTLADTNSTVSDYTITNNSGTLSSIHYAFNLLNGVLTVTNALSTNVVISSPNPSLPGNPFAVTATISALAPSFAVPDGSVQFVVDGTPVGGPVMLTNGIATTNLTLVTHGFRNISAEYAGNTNVVGSTNSVSQLINTPPTAGTATFPRLRNLPLKFRITDLLTNATDVDGDAVTLVSIGTTSTNGVSITNDLVYVYYTPPTNANVADAFSYTVSDTFGATNQGTVLITVAPDNNSPSVNITAVATLPDGTVQINFAGIPGRSYLVQGATNVTPPIPWVTLNTNVAGTNGLFFYIDLDATNFPSRFYRTATP